MTEFVPPGTRFVDLPSPFPMRRGGALVGARLAYETWGTLNAAGDNAILILPGLSPNAHAASNGGNAAEGWWEGMLGPGKAIDTHRWFVICVNPLGSCKGSTGAASPHPEDGAPYRLRFPDLSIEDGADAAAHLVRALGIERLDTVIGNSMGGMSALALLLRHPGIARRHVNISGSARSLPFSIAIRSLQREAIRLDPQWADGQYTDKDYPENGMRMARKLGVVTYRSAMEW
ncbi:MAG: alpha/beta fold hydrolase, partial [Lysobacteraceae bacterium]